MAETSLLIFYNWVGNAHSAKDRDEGSSASEKDGPKPTSSSSSCSLGTADTTALHTSATTTLGVIGMVVGGIAACLGLLHAAQIAKEPKSFAPTLKQAEVSLLVLMALFCSLSWLIPSSGYSSHLHILLWLEVFLKPAIVVTQIFRNCALRWTFRSYHIRMELAGKMDITQRQAETTVEEIDQDLEKQGDRRIRLATLCKVVLAYAVLAAITIILQFAGPECMGLSVGGTMGLMSVEIFLCAMQLVVFALVKSVHEAFLVQRELCILVAINFCSCGVLLALSQMGMFGGAQPTIGWMLASRVVNPAIALLSLATGISCNLARSKKLQKGQAQEFDDLFMNEPARAKFREYLDLEFSAQLYLFWQHVEDYAEAFNAKDEEVEEAGSNPAKGQSALRKDMVRKAKMGIMARNIFQKYIRPNAPLNVCVPSTLRAEITNRVNNNSISVNIFEAAQNHVYEQMRSSYPMFCEHVDAQKHTKLDDVAHVHMQSRTTIDQISEWSVL